MEFFVTTFSSDDPFPLLNIQAYTYSEAKVHAQAADQWIGFQFAEIEDQIAKGQNDHQVWRGLPIASLMTPYLELRTLLDLLDLREVRHIVDLGCAYGRMAHVVGRQFPEVQFTGYEIEESRVREGLRVLQPFFYKNLSLITQDLSSHSFTPPAADVFFIYDFGHKSAIEKTLSDLRDQARKGHRIQVVARGRLSRHVIHESHPWLYAVQTPKHYLNFSIYSS